LERRPNAYEREGVLRARAVGGRVDIVTGGSKKRKKATLRNWVNTRRKG